MAKRKKRILFILLISLLTVSCIIREKKFLEGTMSYSWGGVTFEVEHLYVTEDRLAVTVKGGRNNGEDIGSDLVARRLEWRPRGIDHDSLNGGGGQTPSDYVENIYFGYNSPYEKEKESAFLTFRVANLGHSRPKDSKWIWDYPGTWRLCIPIEQTHPTEQYEISREVILNGNAYILKEIRIDVLGVGFTLEQVIPNPEIELVDEELWTVEVVYEDGSSQTLWGSIETISQVLNPAKDSALEWNYIVEEYTEPEKEGFPLIDVENIKSIYFYGMDLLNPE